MYVSTTAKRCRAGDPAASTWRIGRPPPPARGDCSPQAWGAEKDQLAADMRELVIEASRSLPAAQRQAAEEMLMHELQRLTQQAPSATHGAWNAAPTWFLPVPCVCA